MNMNKQEVIEKVKTLKPDEQNLHEYQPEEWEAFKDGFDDAKCYAELAVEKLEEPEKPVVPQFVADWYEDNKGDLEFYIYDLCADYRNNKLEDNELREWFGNDSRTKPIETLMKMKFYGYEVEKEKLYTAKLKISNEYLHYDKSYKKFHHYAVHEDWANKKEEFHFTEDDLTKYNAWENEVYEVEEVEE